MTELFTVVAPGAAFATLAEHCTPVLGTEIVSLPAGLGRVSASGVDSPETLPAFARSTMDGYAVRCAETFGASDAAPAYLRLDGEVEMGRRDDRPIAAGTARRIHTGAMLPPGADGVIIIEETNLRGLEIEVLRPGAPGEHVVAIGEDVTRGDGIVEEGRRLGPADLGGLAAVGIGHVLVRKKPRVAVLSTGDEVVPIDALPAMGQVRDVNATTIGAVIEAAGGIPLWHGIVPDDETRLFEAARDALAQADALVLSAGSSVSQRDMTAKIVQRLGPPGVFVHGIALRPGKPTVLAACGEKPVIGLPGNPVSALVVAWRLVRPMVRLLGGERVAGDGLDDAGERVAVAAQNFPSRSGREDYVPVRLAARADGRFDATPIFGKSSLIFSLVRADGIAIVPLDSAGIAAGSVVRVIVP